MNLSGAPCRYGADVSASASSSRGSELDLVRTLAVRSRMIDDPSIGSGVMQHDCRLFVYGTLRQGEPRHALLAGAEWLGAALTATAFHLVDLGPYAALVRGGATAVQGELYGLDAQARRAIDVALEVPILFTRELIALADGAEADTYLLTMDQVRGRRRIAHGDWKQRFSRNVPSSNSPSRAGGAWAEWSRNRWKK
jgi:gamma-glutamylaminecyclotransferase